jgi:hypothetical protein
LGAADGLAWADRALIANVPSFVSVYVVFVFVWLLRRFVF